jgi:hypothetical protein
MKKLLLGFGTAALFATGCTQPTLDAAPDAFAKHEVYVVTADCGTAACPYPDWSRYVFVTRNIGDARRRLVEVAQEMVAANPGASSVVDAAKQIAFGDAVNPGWTPNKPNRIASYVNGATFTICIDTSYL